MSNLSAQTEVLAAAANKLHSINTALHTGIAAAAAPITGVVPAAADLVSFLTAAQFASHAEHYQKISAQAAAFRDQLATTLGISSSSYATTEDANATLVG